MMDLIPDGLFFLWGHYLEPISPSTKLQLRTPTSLATRQRDVISHSYKVVTVCHSTHSGLFRPLYPVP